MYKKILKAQQRIEQYVKQTDVIYAEKLSKLVNADIYLKLENLQKSGSFKIRGAINKILQIAETQKVQHIVTASAGNHAQGVAIAAKLTNVAATIVMPLHAPKAKVKATKDLGANVILHGQSFDKALAHAMDLNKALKATFVHPFDDDLIIAGQGTIGLEILDVVQDVDQVIVPIGGGGLISGIASAIKSVNPQVKIIGVQTTKVDPMFKAFTNGNLQSIKVSPTIADGIAVGQPAQRTFAIIKKYVDKIVTVSEEEIARSILFLLESCKIVTEGAGAAPVAALFAGKIKLHNKKTVAIISGGNVDVTTLEHIINKALISEYRRFEIKVNLDDTPFALANLLTLISEHDGNLHNIKQGTSRKKLDINQQAVTVVIDTSGKEVNDKIIKALKDHHYNIIN